MDNHFNNTNSNLRKRDDKETTAYQDSDLNFHSDYYNADLDSAKHDPTAKHKNLLSDNAHHPQSANARKESKISMGSLSIGSSKHAPMLSLRQRSQQFNSKVQSMLFKKKDRELGSKKSSAMRALDSKRSTIISTAFNRDNFHTHRPSDANLAKPKITTERNRASIQLAASDVACPDTPPLLSTARSRAAPPHQSHPSHG